MITKEAAYKKISELVERFEEQLVSYKKADYNETLTRRDFIDPFFKALGWDVDNEEGYAQSYREVIHEDKVKVGGATKAPDYSFKLSGGKRLFFVEAKKPSVSIKDEILPAYQLRRYGWSDKLSISVITDFEEFAIYDCTRKPYPTDKASVARIKYLNFKDYLKEFDFIWDTFAKERVLKGSFDKFVQGTANKRGTATVDKDFLVSLDTWRTYLATSISLRNKELDEDELNFVVQQTIDRIIFLRIAEARAVEPYGNLQATVKHDDYYQNLLAVFKFADEKYNSGLFDFKKDTISKRIKVDNKVIKTIINELYYPISPYEFSVLSVEILGSAYEQFLGKIIRITPAHHAKIEEKPEIRKAGGVYYTPQYIVEYIVENTVGVKIKELENLYTNKNASASTVLVEAISEIKIVDPACGSGSFLIGAYQYLLNWHSNYYTQKSKSKSKALTPDGNLTTAEKKRILLNNIYGVDIDTNAVEVTKLSLLLKCLEGETQASIAHQMSMFNERVLPTLDGNIKSGNSLIDTDYYDTQLDFGEERKIKPFNWQKAFPEVFNRQAKTLPKEDLKIIATKAKQHAQKAMEYATQLEEKLQTLTEPTSGYENKYSGGFDCVIGNPPYVDSEEMTKTNITLRNYALTKYQTARGNWDMYCIYTERAISLLNINGRFGFIIPNKFLSAPYGIYLKAFISQYQLENIEDYTEVSVFENDRKINVYPVIIIVEKTINKKNSTYTKYIEADNNIIKKSSKTFFLEKNYTEWTTVFNQESVLINKIQLASVFIKEHYKVENSATVNEAYLIKDVLEDCIDSKEKVKLVNTGTIDRYLNNWGIKSTQYIKGKYTFPVISKVNLNKILPNRIDSIYKDKIVLAGMIKVLEGTILDKNFYPAKSTTLILKIESSGYDLKYLLGLINSKLYSFIYLVINKYNAMSGGYMNVSKKQLDDFIFYPINFDNPTEKSAHDQIIKLVEQLLLLNQEKSTTKLQSAVSQIETKIEYCEDKINELVYQLYELTAEEIEIVEGK